MLTWFGQHPTDHRGTAGAVRKSNRTDNESTKMATSRGVTQGYTCVITVDAAHLIIVVAQAHGVGAKQELLLPVVAATTALRTPNSIIVADAGYHREANLRRARGRAGTRSHRERRHAPEGCLIFLASVLHDTAPCAALQVPNAATAGRFRRIRLHLRSCDTNWICPAGESL